MSQSKRPLTIAQSVAVQTREQILKREIAGGEPLRQEAIAKSFGTSIIPVREALRQLEAEGNKHIDHPDRIVFFDIFVNGFGE